MKTLKIVILLICSSFSVFAATEKLEIMVPSGSYVSFVRNVVAPEFKKLHPNVRLLISNDEQLETRLAAGDTPNVYIGVFGYQPAKLARLGQLAYLNKFDNFDGLSDRVEEHFMRKNFGRNYYIPWNATTQMMIYNKALFIEAGLNPDEPPKTWDEFLIAAEKISALPNRENGSQVYGTVFWNDVLGLGSWYWSMLVPMYYSINQGHYGLLNHYGTDIVFDKPEAKMIEYMNVMRKAHEFAPATMENSFFSRNIGMWLQFGFGWKSTLTSAADRPMIIGEDVGIAPIPVLKEGDIHYSNLDGRALMIFKSTKEKEQLSWDLINLLMRDDINLQANIELGQLPTLKSLKKNEYFQSSEAKPFVDQLDNAILGEPFSEISDVVDILLSNYARMVLKNEITPEQALQESANSARKLLNIQQ